MKRSYLITAIFVVVVGILWVNRYSVTAPNQYGSYAKLDRWTGKVIPCSVVGGSC